jgi:NADPH2:quinone reductase
MSALPASMRYVAARGAGGPDVLELDAMEPPLPREDEVLIRVQAAGVNRPDVAQRQGKYPPPPGASPVIGLEVAGEVVALGAAVGRWRVGDQVTALTNGGGYAEYCVAPETQCLPWPAGFTAVQAASLPETFFTVWANLMLHGRFQPGESVLVHGGTSGIGVTAIQLVTALGGKAYATAGSAEKCAACVSLGAVAAMDYREEDFAKRLAELTHGHGVDIILDIVGAPYFEQNLASLAMDGRLVQVSTMQGAVATKLDLFQVMRRRLVITGSTMRPRTTAEKGEIAAALEARVWPLLRAGNVRPVIHSTFPFAAAAAAHRLMESSTHIGKIVLKPTAEGTFG